MKMGRREWDMEVFRDMFGERDQLLICEIPLSYRHEEDVRN